MKTINTQDCALGQRSINLRQLMVLKKKKRLLLVNIKEKIYINNSQGNDNPKIHIGLSNFFSLRPKWVVTADDSCMNNVFVCAIYQNVKLMTHAASSNDTYKNLLEGLVCDINSRACMMKQCDKCSGIMIT